VLDTRTARGRASIVASSPDAIDPEGRLAAGADRRELRARRDRGDRRAVVRISSTAPAPVALDVSGVYGTFPVTVPDTGAAGARGYRAGGCGVLPVAPATANATEATNPVGVSPAAAAACAMRSNSSSS
jgi:hypothetical protein